MRWFQRRTPKPRLLASASVFVLTLLIAGKALAVSMAEYALLLALIAISLAISVTVPTTSDGHGLHAAVTHLQAYAETAALAHLNGKRGKESAGLGKVISAAKSMEKVTSTCRAYDELTPRLEQIQNVATQLKAQATHSKCKPDGVIGEHEQCDPLAQPTGCPILTLPSFCNDECACAPVPTQPVPCDLPFPATCNTACQCLPIVSYCG
jgi:hypothetical protein